MGKDIQTGADKVTQGLEEILSKQLSEKLPAEINVLVQAIAKGVMEMLRPMLEQQNRIIASLAEKVEEIAESKDREIDKLIQEIRGLSESFESSVKNLPSVVQSQPEVASLINEHKKSLEAVLKKAYTDNLTGLYNRNHLAAILEEERGRWVGMVIDIDHFKHINDTHGHDIGDEVLRNVAETVRKNCPSLGKRRVLPFRLGGEEIGVLVRVRSVDRADPEEEVSFVQLLAEQLRREIKNQCGCTVSIGVADSPIDLPLPPNWEKSEKKGVRFSRIFGDENLYRAKSGGRDRVVMNKAQLVDALKQHILGELAEHAKPAV